MFIIISSLCLYPLQISTTLTQCRFNAGPTLPAPTNTHAILSSASCWCQCVHRVHAATDPMTAKCRASVAGAGQHRFDAGWARVTTMRRVGLYRKHRPNAGLILATACNGAVTLVQPRLSIVSQRILRVG